VIRLCEYFPNLLSVEDHVDHELATTRPHYSRALSSSDVIPVRRLDEMLLAVRYLAENLPDLTGEKQCCRKGYSVLYQFGASYNPGKFTSADECDTAVRKLPPVLDGEPSSLAPRSERRKRVGRDVCVRLESLRTSNDSLGRESGVNPQSETV
jgi:hypothetical protein